MADTERSDKTDVVMDDENASLSQVDPVVAVGARLKQAREQKGFSRAQVADHIKLTQSFVEALDEGALHRLPDKVYTRGFIASYARLVGLNAEEILRLFDSDKVQSGSRTSQLEVEPDLTDRKEGLKDFFSKNSSQILTTLIIFTVVTIGVVIWYLSNSGEGYFSSSSTMFEEDTSTEQDSSIDADIADSTEHRIANETSLTPEPVNNAAATGTLDLLSSDLDTQTNFLDEDAEAEAIEPIEDDWGTATTNDQLATLDDPRDGTDGSEFTEPDDETDLAVLQASSTDGSEDVVEVGTASVVGGSDLSTPEGVENAGDNGAGDSGSVELDAAILEAQRLQKIEEAKKAGLPVGSLLASFVEECWLEVVDRFDEKIYYDLHEAGDTVALTGVAPIKVKVGNADGIRLYYNGDEVALRSSSATRVANVTLR